MRKRLSKHEYLEGIAQADPVILSQAITLAESGLAEDQELVGALLKEIFPATGNSLRIGISGIPGAGKSTFIEGLGKQLTSLNKKIAVLTVDPSSSISKGSILGDKTRMELLAADPLAMIRTSPSQRYLGGVTPHTRKVIALCEAAGYEIIVIETVGAGQSETEVRDMTDFFILLLIGGAGDELQGMKKGIVEISDLIVVNKADGMQVQAAINTQKELENALHLSLHQHQQLTEVMTFSSLDKSGFDALWEKIYHKIETLKHSGAFEKRRVLQNISWMNESIRYQLLEDFHSSPQIKDGLEKTRKEVMDGKISGMDAASRLLKIFKSNL